MSHAFNTAADFQAVANDRSAGFGIGDITATVQLPDGRRFFTLGDTLYYNLMADGRAGPLKGFGNNSAWVQSGNCFTLVDRAGPGVRSWLLPPERDGSVYWPGGAVVVGNRLYVFLTRLFLDNPFGTPVGSAVASFNLPSLTLARITPIPFKSPHVFGIGAVYDGGYVYTYASQGNTCKFCFAGDLFVARARESNIWSPASWRYRSGSQWVTDPNAATPVLRAGVSNADVQRYGNGFLLITKPLSIVAPEVEARWSPTPIGPWQDLGTVFSVPQPPHSWVPGFTYHQSYTYGPTVLAGTRLADGGYLASYNVNSFDATDGQRDGRMGGPRFLSVRLPRPRPRRPASAARAVAVGADVRRGPARERTHDSGRIGVERLHGARAVAIAHAERAADGLPRPTEACSRSATRSTTDRWAACDSTSRSWASPRRRAARATGSSRPTAASSRSATRVLRLDGQPPQPADPRDGRDPERQGLLVRRVRRRRVHLRRRALPRLDRRVAAAGTRDRHGDNARRPRLLARDAHRPGVRVRRRQLRRECRAAGDVTVHRDRSRARRLPARRSERDGVPARRDPGPAPDRERDAARRRRLIGGQDEPFTTDAGSCAKRVSKRLTMSSTFVLPATAACGTPGSKK